MRFDEHSADGDKEKISWKKTFFPRATSYSLCELFGSGWNRSILAGRDEKFFKIFVY